MNRTRWSITIVAGLAALALAGWEDAARYVRVADLSAQGNPPPAVDPHSPTGYAGRQRYFLGAEARGETFRWIMAVEGGSPPAPGREPLAPGDDEPTEKPRLAPSLYAAALKAIARGGNLFWQAPPGIAVERAAVVAPLVLQGLLVAATIGAAAVGFGAEVAGLFGVLLLLVPFVTDQFLPGVLEPGGAAVFLGVDALLFAGALCAEAGGALIRQRFCALASALCAFAALWLDPAVGVPLILSIASARLLMLTGRSDRRELPWMWWGGVGAVLTVAAAFAEGVPVDPKVSELRAIHPYHALAWFGAGWLLHTVERARVRGWRATDVVQLVLAVLAVAWPLGLPIARGFPGWWGPDDAMERLTLLANTPASATAFGLFGAVPGIVAVVAIGPICGALGIAVWRWRHSVREGGRSADSMAFAALSLLTCTVYGVLRVRWLVLADCLALLVLALALSRTKVAPSLGLRVVGLTVAMLTLAFAGVGRLASIKAAREQTADASDLEALVYRDLAQWLVNHAAPGSVGVLAPPELTDALEYHGDFRGLIDTAWETRDNALTASRILSAVLPEEAESLLRKRRINYLAVPSWDKVLGHLVRTTEEKKKFALHSRLERWAPPHILRPIPYQMPPAKGLEGQVIALYQLVEAQDEALALSRLAEYFAEMDNDYLAKAAANVLGSSFPGDPNAAIARALVFKKVGDSKAFEAEAAKVAAIEVTEEGEFDWDRQVARAIVLALANRADDAAKAIQRCMAGATETRLYSLTPLQVYRLNLLAKRYGLAYPAPDLASLAARLSDQLVGASH